MGQAQINVRTRACSRTSIARTRQAALTHNVRGKELKQNWSHVVCFVWSREPADTTEWSFHSYRVLVVVVLVQVLYIYGSFSVDCSS